MELSAGRPRWVVEQVSTSIRWVPCGVGLSGFLQAAVRQPIETTGEHVARRCMKQHCLAETMLAVAVGSANRTPIMF